MSTASLRSRLSFDLNYVPHLASLGSKLQSCPDVPTLQTHFSWRWRVELFSSEHQIAHKQNRQERDVIGSLYNHTFRGRLLRLTLPVQAPQAVVPARVF